MSAIETTPPPEGSYIFVLRRYDKDCIHKIALYSYDEPTESRAIELDGVVAHTAFLSTQPARDYWCKKGWIDETAKWMARHPAQPPGGPGPGPEPTDSEKATGRDEPRGAASAAEQGREEAAGTPPLRSELDPKAAARTATEPDKPLPADPDARLVARARNLIRGAGKPMTVGMLIPRLGEPEARVRGVLHAAAEAGQLAERGHGALVSYGLPAAPAAPTAPAAPIGSAGGVVPAEGVASAGAGA